MVQLSRISGILLCFWGLAYAHKPAFPEGSSPYQLIDAPTLSQAFYLNLAAGESHSFIIPPVARAVPVEVLVLDNELGRKLAFSATWTCDGESRPLKTVDVAFHETFSGLDHRYRIIDAVGPTSEPCQIDIRELNQQAGPYTFAIGDEEKFSLADMFSLLGLQAKLNAWQSQSSKQ